MKKDEIKNPFLDIVDRVIKPNFDALFENTRICTASENPHYARSWEIDHIEYDLIINNFKTYLNEEYDYMFSWLKKIQDNFKTQYNTFTLTKDDIRFYLRASTVIKILKSILDFKIFLIFDYLYHMNFTYYEFKDQYNMFANTIINSVNNMSFSESDKKVILEDIASSLDMNAKGFNNLSFNDLFEFKKNS